MIEDKRNFYRINGFNFLCGAWLTSGADGLPINLYDQLVRVSKTAKDQHIEQSTKTHIVREIDMADRLFAMLVNLKREDRELCFKLGIAKKSYVP